MEIYILVEHPDDSSHFENEEIGYPCFNSEDNGARYVPLSDYFKHTGKFPVPSRRYSPVQWPESQKFLDVSDDRCEVIMADEKALADFGGSSVWVPLVLLSRRGPKYADVLEKVREKFSAEIAEADANPDKWYEIFVTEEDESTITERRCFTFDEVVENFGAIADQWGVDKTSMDI